MLSRDWAPGTPPIVVADTEQHSGSSSPASLSQFGAVAEIEQHAGSWAPAAQPVVGANTEQHLVNWSRASQPGAMANIEQHAGSWAPAIQPVVMADIEQHAGSSALAVQSGLVADIEQHAGSWAPACQPVVAAEFEEDLECLTPTVQHASNSALALAPGLAFVTDVEEHTDTWAPAPVAAADSEQHAVVREVQLSPGERHCTFVLKPGDRFGLVLDERMAAAEETRGTLVVRRVNAGSPFAETVEGGQGVNAGDVIVEVNGQRGDAAEVREVLRKAVCAGGEQSISLVVLSRRKRAHS